MPSTERSAPARIDSRSAICWSVRWSWARSSAAACVSGMTARTSLSTSRRRARFPTSPASSRRRRPCSTPARAARPARPRSRPRRRRSRTPRSRRWPPTGARETDPRRREPRSTDSRKARGLELLVALRLELVARLPLRELVGLGDAVADREEHLADPRARRSGPSRAAPRRTACGSRCSCPLVAHLLAVVRPACR